LFYFLCVHFVHLGRWGETSEGIPNEAIDHSSDAILASQYVANLFVNQARLSQHRFPSEPEEDAALIDNYQPSKTTGSFMQEYFFHF
jgi:gamma-glutamyl hydrolase